MAIECVDSTPKRQPRCKPKAPAKAKTPKPVAGAKATPSAKPSGRRAAPRKPRAWDAPARKPRRARRGGTTILHTCGHEEKHKLSSVKWKKERELKYHAAHPCNACWALAKAEEAEALSGVDPSKLVQLTGTTAQILWARTIRGLMLARVTGEAIRIDRERRKKDLEPASDRFLALALPGILRKRSARWWIDVRDEDQILDLALDSMSMQALEELRGEADKVVLPPQAVDPDFCPF